MNKQLRLTRLTAIKSVWPQVPLGLLLLFTGAVNILTRLHIHVLNAVYQSITQVTPLSELSQEVSIGMLGSGAQLLLGGGMLVCGIGLFWRLRSAWAFSILFLIIAVVVELFSYQSIYNVFPCGLALAAMVVWQSRFDHRSLVGSYLMSFFGLLAVFAYGIFGSLLLGYKFQPGIHDLSTALYFTVTTLSTVGGNIYPTTTESQIFIVTLILGGLSIFTTTIVTTFGPLLSNRSKPIESWRKAKVEPSGHVVLIGTSFFARSVALELAHYKINFIQVVNPESTPPLSEQPIVYGNPNDEEVLKKAGILIAGTVVVASEDDAVNAAASMIAKKLNPKVRVIVVESSPQTILKTKIVYADMTFSPTDVGARLVTNLIRGTSMSTEMLDLFTGN